MDRETAVKLWREIGAGMPGGGATGRLIEAFALAVEAAERERCAKQFVENGREIGRQEERERIAKNWDGCIHEGMPCNMDIGASIRVGELVPWVGGA